MGAIESARETAWRMLRRRVPTNEELMSESLGRESAKQSFPVITPPRETTSNPDLRSLLFGLKTVKGR